MTSPTFEQRTADWLETGPARVPVEAVEYVLAAIQTVPQERPLVDAQGWARLVRRLRGDRRALGLALVATIVAGVGAGIMIERGQRHEVAATPVPSASGIPDSTGLLADMPIGVVHLSRAVGEASASLSPDSTPQTVELGHVQINSRFVVGGSCRGAGAMLVQVFGVGQSTAFMNVPVQCDGRVVRVDSLDHPTGSTGDGVARPSGVRDAPGQDVRLSVPVGASWRVAIGEYLPSVTVRPSFATIAPSAGWTSIAAAGPAEVGAPTFLDLRVPDRATRLGVFVDCHGEGSTTIQVGASTSDVVCPTVNPQRLELTVVGGDQLAIRTIPAGLVWARLVVEVNSELVFEHPAAPTLPAGLGDVPYALTDGEYLGLGTLGSSRQSVIQLQGVQVGTARGDFATVVSGPPVPGVPTQLDLWSVREGRPLRTLATVEPPASVWSSWIDLSHDQVFYTVSGRAGGGVEVRRVGTDGTGDRLVASVPSDNIPAAGLSPDDSFFLIETCTPIADCTRRIIDTVSFAERTIQVEDGETCQLVGIVDSDQLVVLTADACGIQNPGTRIEASAMDGSDRRSLGGGIAPEFSGQGSIIPTSTGPKYVFVSIEPDGTLQRFNVQDIATGEIIELSLGEQSPANPATSQSQREISPILLPDDWLLLSGWLGDFPTMSSGERPIPVLINLVTGERIELINLPH